MGSKEWGHYCKTVIQKFGNGYYKGTIFHYILLNHQDSFQRMIFYFPGNLYVLYFKQDQLTDHLFFAAHMSQAGRWYLHIIGTPCITCVQCIDGIRCMGVFSALGCIISAFGGIPSVHWMVFSALGVYYTLLMH